MLNLRDFIQVFIFTTNHHLKVDLCYRAYRKANSADSDHTASYPLYTDRLFHCYMLDESICHFRDVRSILSFFFFFFFFLFLCHVTIVSGGGGAEGGGIIFCPYNVTLSVCPAIHLSAHHTLKVKVCVINSS